MEPTRPESIDSYNLGTSGRRVPSVMPLGHRVGRMEQLGIPRRSTRRPQGRNPWPGARWADFPCRSHCENTSRECVKIPRDQARVTAPRGNRNDRRPPARSTTKPPTSTQPNLRWKPRSSRPARGPPEIPFRTRGVEDGQSPVRIPRDRGPIAGTALGDDRDQVEGFLAGLDRRGRPV